MGIYSIILWFLYYGNLNFSNPLTRTQFRVSGFGSHTRARQAWLLKVRASG